MKSCQRKSKMTFTKKQHFDILQLSDILSCLYHHRCSSAKNSPYQNQTSIERLKQYLETTTRNKSPRFPTNISLKSSKTKSSSKSQLKKPNKWNQKNKANKLVELTSKDIKFAPQVFVNQFFIDAYDSSGNHDRLMLTPHSSVSHIEDDSKLISGELIILESTNQSTNSDIQIKQPQNSYHSQEKTSEAFHAALVQKLSNLEDKF